MPILIIIHNELEEISRLAEEMAMRGIVPGYIEFPEVPTIHDIKLEDRLEPSYSEIMEELL